MKNHNTNSTDPADSTKPINRIDSIELSKTISHALRHEPWVYELEPDAQGWVELTDLIEALKEGKPKWSHLDLSHIKAMMANADKQRYETNGPAIRALYGHSMPGRIEAVQQQPPNVLYHGTSERGWKKIQTEGLRPMNRHYVHLSSTKEMALQVGSRKDKNPLLLTVTAQQAANDGICFYKGNELVWLADVVPSEYLYLG